MVRKYLNRLSDLILLEMENRRINSKEFSVLCGVSEREVSSIKNRERSDLKLSIVVKICENTDISYADIFDVSDNDIFDRMAIKFFLTDGTVRYGIKRLHL